MILLIVLQQIKYNRQFELKILINRFSYSQSKFINTTIEFFLSPDGIAYFFD